MQPMWHRTGIDRFPSSLARRIRFLLHTLPKCGQPRAVRTQPRGPAGAQPRSVPGQQGALRRDEPSVSRGERGGVEREAASRSRTPWSGALEGVAATSIRNHARRIHGATRVTGRRLCDLRNQTTMAPKRAICSGPRSRDGEAARVTLPSLQSRNRLAARRPDVAAKGRGLHRCVSLVLHVLCNAAALRWL